MDILDKQLTLALNAHWYALGCVSIRKAITALCSESNDDKAALAMDITMGIDENGNDVLISAIPTEWDDWIHLPIRDSDLFIQTVNMKIRAPTVIISRRYEKIPMKRPRLSARAIMERDNFTCQYTNRKLSRSDLNIDHVLPKDRGGKELWENLVCSDRKVNSLKGNKLNSEIGLKLIRIPKAPPAIPVSISITEARHSDWKPFLIK